MFVISCDNVNDAFRHAVSLMLHSSRWRTISPRGRETREFDAPVVTHYKRPWRRVLFSSVRDANPFFHLMESLWMLAGRNDAEWISQFSSNIAQFAEDDGYFHGAYGHRWRKHFAFDQLHSLAAMLREDRDTRRAVLAMWDTHADFRNVSAWPKKDIPCNTHVYFKIRDDKLHMTVCCRSNDIIWGCYGANAVHFSVLQEFVARAANVEIGDYFHVSDSWHFYTDNPTWRKLDEGARLDFSDYYNGHGYTPTRVASAAIVNGSVAVWLSDLARFMTDDWDDPTVYDDIFFSGTAYPMRDAWRCWKRGDLDAAMTRALAIQSPDWKMACASWLQRRQRSQET